MMPAASGASHIPRQTAAAPSHELQMDDLDRPSQVLLLPFCDYEVLSFWHSICHANEYSHSLVKVSADDQQLSDLVLGLLKQLLEDKWAYDK